MTRDAFYRIVRFFISGSTAAAVNLGILFVLVEFFDIWYITASVLGFCLAFIVSFTLHKFWTFGHGDVGVMHTQFIRFFAIVVTNLGLNTLFVYLLVEYAGLYPVIAQALSGLTIACESFLAYKYFVFHRTEDAIDNM